MAFQVSPGVLVQERDLTNIIPAVTTSIGGTVGVFEWGPALELTTVSDEADLINKFGYPRISSTAGLNSRLDWYNAANFLSYSNNLSVVRVLADGARNSASEIPGAVTAAIEVTMSGTPTVTPAAGDSDQHVIEYNDGETVTITVTDAHTTVEDYAQLFATALEAANVQAVIVNGAEVEYSSNGITLPGMTTVNGIDIEYVAREAVEAVSAASINSLDDFIFEDTTLQNGTVYGRFPGTLGNGIGVAIIDAGISDSDFRNARLFGSLRPADIFDTVPGTSAWGREAFGIDLDDEVHIVVYTTDTLITGETNEILETYSYLSKAKNGKTADGGQNHYIDVVNTTSKWIYMINEETASLESLPEDPTDPTEVIPRTMPNDNGVVIGTTLTNANAGVFKKFLTNAGFTGIRRYTLSGGADGDQVSDASRMRAWDIFNDVEVVDVNLLITGDASVTVQKYVIDIAETRKDCVAFVSPGYDAAVINPTADTIVDYFNNSTTGFNSSSYAVFDSAWKRQYDRHNDEYFWIPLNADIAGLCARSDYNAEAWFSPAGLNRGFIRNVVKLSYNPNQAGRDRLYTNRVNPVVTFRGQGTLLYGDKTALSRPSAFDRINVRRLFITLQKAISTASKYQLFEFNDDITRRLFVNAVEPYLADIKSRRGITDFRVVCDTSNNTGEVIDSNRFVADIYIKPNRSINFIRLNFAAVRSGVSFSEILGA